MSYLAGTARSARTAWCPLPENGSVFAAASAAGSTDSDFDATAFLETFSVNAASDTASLPPKKKVELPDRVHSLAWGTGGTAGILAAGLPDGTINFLDAATVMGQKYVSLSSIHPPQPHYQEGALMLTGCWLLRTSTTPPSPASSSTPCSLKSWPLELTTLR